MNQANYHGYIYERSDAASKKSLGQVLREVTPEGGTALPGDDRSVHHHTAPDGLPVRQDVEGKTVICMILCRPMVRCVFVSSFLTTKKTLSKKNKFSKLKKKLIE